MNINMQAQSCSALYVSLYIKASSLTASRNIVATPPTPLSMIEYCLVTSFITNKTEWHAKSTQTKKGEYKSEAVAREPVVEIKF